MLNASCSCIYYSINHVGRRTQTGHTGVNERQPVVYMWVSERVWMKIVFGRTIYRIRNGNMGVCVMFCECICSKWNGLTVVHMIIYVWKVNGRRGRQTYGNEYRMHSWLHESKSIEFNSAFRRKTKLCTKCKASGGISRVAGVKSNGQYWGAGISIAQTPCSLLIVSTTNSWSTSSIYTFVCKTK